MKVIILGNAGSGKTTLAKKLQTKQPVAILPLDNVAFHGGVERRPLADSIADVTRFIEDNESWIIEGCYADIVEPILPRCETLIFLNPGVDACVAHCRGRQWEPDKFASRSKQDEHLENLIEWVRSYETRQDEYGLRSHRALFDAFPGDKREMNHPEQYATD